MHWKTFKYFLQQVTKKFIQKLICIYKFFLGEKGLDFFLQSFFKIIPLAPSYRFWPLHSSRSCQNTCKMHVVQISFGRLHKQFNISSILFSHVNQCLMVAFNVFHIIQTFFFHLSGPLWMPLALLVTEWQHLVLAQVTLFGMQPILDAMHRVLMSPPKVASTLCPFPLTMPPKHDI
jgi:hypothetical protein